VAKKKREKKSLAKTPEGHIITNTFARWGKKRSSVN
jgi:hypothetical protein